MRITEIVCTPVFVPLEKPTRSSLGRRTGTYRTVVQLRTDEGITGIGETLGGTPTRYLIERMANQIVGESAFAVEGLLHRLRKLPYFYGYNGFMAMCGVEMACWDAIGKAAGRPVADLMGGALRRDIPVAGYIFARETGPGGEVQSHEEILEDTVELIERFGFTVIKYKSEGNSDTRDLAVVKGLRERFGQGLGLRVDPNAAWDYSQALRMAKALEPYDLEYLEDPVEFVDTMSRLRREVRIPFATNMCVVNFEELPLAIRNLAVDVVLGDQHHWGGLWNSKKLAAVCETFKITMSWHSGGDLGISTAASLHLLASTPIVSHAMDSHYLHYVDDVITTRFEYRNGHFRLPDGPGLGVELDPDALAKYARMHDEMSTGPLPKGYQYPI
jgi:glucarate dehydratase